MTPPDAGFLSRKPIAPADRLIFALDIPGAEDAVALVDRLGADVGFYKIGLELFMAGGYFELLQELAARGKRVFVDLKLFDVPETVGRAVRRLSELPATFVSVHGNDGILAAAVREKGGLGVLAVTVLTSLDQGDVNALGFQADVSTIVLSRARRALELGCDGVVSSGLEVAALRRELGDRLAVVVPGIRPVINRAADDQKRTIDVEDAFRAGADYIVVGRPIRDAADPAAAARAIQDRIAALFAARGESA